MQKIVYKMNRYVYNVINGAELDSMISLTIKISKYVVTFIGNFFVNANIYNSFKQKVAQFVGGLSLAPAPAFA